MIRSFATTALTLLALCGTAGHSRAAFDPTDPFRGNRPIAPSQEFVAFRASGTSLLPTLFDAAEASDGSGGGVDVHGLTEVQTYPDSHRGSGYEFDGAAADFDGDGVPELAYSYEDSDGRIYTRVIDLDGQTLDLIGPSFPALNPAAGSTTRRERQIRLLAGQTDDDEGRELVLAYRDGSGVRIEYYDVDPVTFALTRIMQTSWADDTSCNAYNTSYGALYGSVTPNRRFDIELGDVDGDEVDELVVARVTESCVATFNPNWHLSYPYDLVDAQITSDIEMRVRETTGWVGDEIVTVWTETALESVGARFQNVALATGNFDGGAPIDQIAVTFGHHRPNLRYAWNVFYDVVSDQAQAVSTWGIAEHPSGVQWLMFWSEFDGADHRMDLVAEDFDLDGSAELVLLFGNSLLLFETDPSLTLGIDTPDGLQGANLSILMGTNTGTWESGLGRLLVADVDSSASETFAKEVLVPDAGDGTLRAIRIEKDPSSAYPGWTWQDVADVSWPNQNGEPIVLVGLDVDDDGLYLGAPRREIREQIVQPLVVLNAPPIHFDAFDGGNEVYDVSTCWDLANTGFDCGHEAIYTLAQGMTVDVSSEVAATWAVSSEVHASAGIDLGFVSGSVEAHLENEVGQDFAYTGFQSTTVSETLEASARQDDVVFGTRTDYTIVEYPIYVGRDRTTPVTDVVAVVPDNVQEVWFDSKGSTQLQLLQDHEPGNVLSYKQVGDPFENAMVDVDLAFDAVGGTFEISPFSSYDWTLDFATLSGSENQQASRQNVSQGVSADLSVNAFGASASIGASVEGSYGSEQIRTHRTTVETTGQLRVSLRDLDGGITVDGVYGGLDWANYFVTPYAYWSYSGALVVDYAVELPESTQAVPTLWSELYGQAPDLALSMPWRFDSIKVGVTVSGTFAERTRDIVVTPRRPRPGDIVTFQARVQNYSLVPSLGGTLHFYLEDPRAGGDWIGSVAIPALDARGEVVVELAGWEAPVTLSAGSLVYAEIVPNDAQEIRSENNLAWNYTDVIGDDDPVCSNGFDDDGDGLIDLGEDGGCTDADDGSEREPGFVCDDGFDDDGDGLADFPDDPGCRNAHWPSEAPACSDGIDNDGDGLADYDGAGLGAADPGCGGKPWIQDEESTAPKCGLGFEGGLLAALARLRRRKKTPRSRATSDAS